eukprot:COSAG02_NODE_244_length_27402_cov_41.050397_2_plen_93_part_00
MIVDNGACLWQRYEFSKSQWRKGDDLSSCKRCTSDHIGAASMGCPTCGEPPELHYGGCCGGPDIGSFSGSHKGNDRPHMRPLGVMSFPVSAS